MKIEAIIIATMLVFTGGVVSAQDNSQVSGPNNGKSGDRDVFDVDFNLGWQFDNFTASDIIAATNPDDSGETNNSALLDIRVNWQLVEQDKLGLWLYGNTSRTIRGTEVICKDNPKFFGCSEGELSAKNLDPNTAFTIINEAESLEAHIGLRLERAMITNDIAPGSLYISAQKGFASVDGTDDLAEIDQLAIGLVVTKNSFRNSFIEIGRGNNDLFPTNSDDRNIVRVHLEHVFAENFIGFLESEVDYDSGTGADSVRTKLGFEIPLSGLFGNN